MYPDRETWAKDAEHYVRTVCDASERVSRYPADWLPAGDLAEARALAVQVVKATRTALTRAGQADRRPALNAYGRNAAEERADVDDLRFAWQDILRIAKSVDSAPEQAARLAELAAKMRTARDQAAEEALRDAIAREVARRGSDAGWKQELERRAGLAGGFRL